ncbi:MULTISPECIES: SWIM zinc finger family protein [Rhizobium/Agrobacterium group]|uniref:SWIM zinc finger family protein n=2 Tax=Neorhizobium TaxID=1525371 RepID=A0ABV0MEP9_9HYPH|nr:MULTISPECIES: SWIM zinc finger family protein [Rhizobium/Agrobacterium group]MCC2609676.1 SWIM zinc finger family protein [Neorhizobium petrolearium]WGI69874.1 SWIM zinc finger family protein [Neorhizobium petrolearium]
MKLQQHHISTLFDQRYIDRGKAYFEEGLVEIISFQADKVTSRCAGTRLYRVELVMKDSQLTGQCTCPAFSDFGPCKHMAATAFAATVHTRDTYRPSAVYIARRDKFEALKRQLRRMTKAELIDIIAQHLGDDEELTNSILASEEERE